MVCEASQLDKEAEVIQLCIPKDMSYMGFYPYNMKSFDIVEYEPENPFDIKNNLYLTFDTIDDRGYIVI
jgi:hypothetical protein